jgi:hypothetical protein
VLSTDYNEYSIVYSCSKLLGFYKAEFAWILSRVKQLSPSAMGHVLSVLKTKVPSYDTNRLYFTKQGGENCKYMTEEMIGAKYYTPNTFLAFNQAAATT